MLRCVLGSIPRYYGSAFGSIPINQGLAKTVSYGHTRHISLVSIMGVLLAYIQQAEVRFLHRGLVDGEPPGCGCCLQSSFYRVRFPASSYALDFTGG